MAGARPQIEVEFVDRKFLALQRATGAFSLYMQKKLLIALRSWWDSLVAAATCFPISGPLVRAIRGCSDKKALHFVVPTGW